jgi:hypothetical protein
MTISKLITELQKVQAEHGDVPVEIDGPEWIKEFNSIKLCYPHNARLGWYEEDKTQPVRSIILS